MHRFTEGVSLPAEERYWKWASMASPASVNDLFSHETKSKVSAAKRLNDLYQWNISGDDLNEVLLADMNLVLVGDMLVKVDMMSMANSLEVRSPFLDQEVVDFAFGLPASYKIDATMKKKILQDCFRELLPPELYNRPKQGFDIPLLDWFRRELWSKIDNELLAEDLVKRQGIFDADAIAGLKKKLHSKNPEDVHETIWALLVFQHWWLKNFA